ncbi:MAG TPA: outer membrane protein assembly factor BamA [Thermoanaerobaculia bacterium]|nr:outer membrane protein assembly factor BamA [Thermoanaerobaculia bacterium]HUM29719.1 outer membrane protein assembly factor BamA [Thermoanaerobaculia bacterium]HXK67019.1 outer membrane protein assembly factor BamA [Thermoanaerobaculia bacterium]
MKPSLAILSLLLILSGAFFAFAEDNPPVITSIEVEGNVSVAKETILYYLQIKEGDPYIPAKIQHQFQTLVETQLFSNAWITDEKEDENVRLTIHVVERPILKEIDYENNKALSDSQIREKFEQKKLRFQVGMPLREDIIQQAKAAIIDAYKELGYPNARVEVRVEDLGKQNRKAVFTVDEGTKMRILGVHFAGNEIFSTRRLRFTLRKTKKWNWISALSKHGIYNMENINEDIQRVRSLYLKHGYKDIKIGEPRLDIQESNEKGKRGVILTIPIDEGPQYRIRNVTITGATVFPTEELMKQIKLTTGKILNFQQLEDAQDGISELYSARGYLFMRLIPRFTPVEEEEHVLDVELELDEGDQYHLGRVEFTGNTRTLDKVLRRELFIFEGGIFNAPSFRRSIFRLNQLGYFKLDEEKPVDLSFNPDDKTVDALIAGQEHSRNDVQFSFGYSELDGFFGQLYFNTRNFMGRGESLSVGFQTGRRRDFYELTYTTPWFLDRPHLLTGSIYSRTLDYIDFDRESEGFSFGYGIRLGIFSNISLLYNYENILATWSDSYRYVTDDEGHKTPNWSYQDYDVTSSSITPVFSYDGRDDPFDPFKGQAIRGSVKYAGGFLGGEIDLIKPSLEYTLYQPVNRHHTFALHAEYGHIFTISDRKIPFYERFFLGGERSLRGFTTRSIRPENPEDGLLGGNRYFLVNFESIWRIQGPFRFVLFMDMGQTYGEWENWDLGRVRYSTGAEMRIFIPAFMAPLRFIYGINLDPEPGESRSDFQFTIGTNF